jgi:hypothetical protein
VEVIEGPKTVRYVLEPNDHGLSFDLTWTGAFPAMLEAPHYIRQYERVLFDTQRFAQTGNWTGQVVLGDEVIAIEGAQWRGARDRSWGVRPVGEPEPPGIAASGREGPAMSMWNYDPMMFDDYSIVYICAENPDGSRDMENATRVWKDAARPNEHLGRPEHDHELVSGTRRIKRSTLSFPHAPGGAIEIEVTPMIDSHIGVATGYAPEPDWKHGMYQGELVVQGVELDTTKDAERFWGIVDASARFETNTGDVGYGLHEYMFLGDFPKYGLTGMLDGAP